MNFIAHLTNSTNSLDFHQGVNNSDDRPRYDSKHTSGMPMLVISDDGGQFNEDDSSSSVITPIVKGRYAKQREH